MELNTQLKRYIAMSAGDNVAQICKPLQKLNINYFAYMKAYKAGGQFWLSTHPTWSEHYYSHQYQHHSAFENIDIYQPSSGVYLWQLLNFHNAACASIFNDARDIFNIDNGVTIVDEAIDSYEVWHYGSTRENHSINSFYVNNLDLLKRFAAYFKERAAPLAQASESYMGVLPELKGYGGHKADALAESPISTADFLAETSLNRIYPDKNNPREYLTRREIETAGWLIKGKSAEEIGLLTSISKRTVESHVDSMKRKLDCFKQCRLGYMLGKLGILDADFDA